VNVYARILVEEARRRGIDVEVLDDVRNLYRLRHRGRAVTCWESLTERTSAIAMVLAADKRLTRDRLAGAGLPVPRQADAADVAGARAFLALCGRVVVKPARGEQGRGVSVDVRDAQELERAVAEARRHDPEVLLEEFMEGRDLRVIVIDHRFVAAIERRPAEVRGDGRRTVRQLAEARNRELRRITGGESSVPLDAETARTLARADRGWDDVPAAGAVVRLRGTANYHTGGTLADVTVEVGAPIRRAAEEASRVLDLPVVGFDFLAADFGGDAGYVLIEANERPGLANHEPQPTAQRFIDFLFPETAAPSPQEVHR
jgi:GNAT-family acetyltransferase (TIGR03103 family)